MNPDPPSQGCYGAVNPRDPAAAGQDRADAYLDHVGVWFDPAAARQTAAVARFYHAESVADRAIVAAYRAIAEG